MHFIDKNKDPKAAIVAAFRYFNSPGGEKFKLTVQYFYDGPKPNPDPFAEFLKIKHGALRGKPGEQKDGRSPAEGSYFDYYQTLSVLLHSHLREFEEIFERGHGLLDELPALKDGMGATSHLATGTVAHPAPQISSAVSQGVGASMAPQPSMPMVGVGENARGRWGNVMVAKYTREVLDEVEKQAKEEAAYMKKYSAKTVIVDVWPFLPEMFDKSTPAAWPHKKGQPNGPLLNLLQWEGQENDEFWLTRMNHALDAIQEKVYGKGVLPTRPVYSNTSLAGRTSSKDVYRENLESLRTFRKSIDPYDVMSQAGGYKIPLPIRPPRSGGGGGGRHGGWGTCSTCICPKFLGQFPSTCGRKVCGHAFEDHNSGVGRACHSLGCPGCPAFKGDQHRACENCGHRSEFHSADGYATTVLGA